MRSGPVFPHSPLLCHCGWLHPSVEASAPARSPSPRRGPLGFQHLLPFPPSQAYMPHGSSYPLFGDNNQILIFSLIFDPLFNSP